MQVFANPIRYDFSCIQIEDHTDVIYLIVVTEIGNVADP